MVETHKNIDELGGGFEPSPQHMINVRVKDPTSVVGNAVVAKEVSRVEKALGDQGRVLIRPSGTEPVVRVMVEAADEVLCLQFTQELADVVAAENKGEVVSLS
jgi:phosphoglucosamine mutase